MSNIKLTFTIDKLNIILAGLGELPAKISQTLILKIQEKAKAQIKPIDNQVDPKQELSLELILEEINLVLQGLGELPARVSMQLIEEIKMDAQKQLDNSNSPREVKTQTEEPKPESKFSDFNESKVEPKLEHKIEEKLEHKPPHIDVSTHQE